MRLSEKSLSIFLVDFQRKSLSIPLPIFMFWLIFLADIRCDSGSDPLQFVHDARLTQFNNNSLLIFSYVGVVYSLYIFL